MKLRVLLSILFVIATTLTAIHELEHLHGDHDDASCQVCVVGSHLVSSDITDISFEYDLFVSFEPIVLENQLINLHFKKSDNHSNAPPKIS